MSINHYNRDKNMKIILNVTDSISQDREQQNLRNISRFERSPSFLDFPDCLYEKNRNKRALKFNNPIQIIVTILDHFLGAR